MTTVNDEFRRITGFDLPTRHTNHLNDNCERKDVLFSRLTIFYYAHPAGFRLLLKKIKYWLNQNATEELYAAAGYLYYISENFKQAKFYFLKNISLNPDNLDNWMDLAFTLRHLKDHKTCDGILFYFDYVIHYFKTLRLKHCPYPLLRDLIAIIKKRALET